MKRSVAFIVTLTITNDFPVNGFLVLAQYMTAKDFVQEAEKHITSISVADPKALFNEGGIAFLHVRKPKEHKAGHIPAAAMS